MAGRGNYSNKFGPASKKYSSGKTPPRQMRATFARVDASAMFNLLGSLEEAVYAEADAMLEKAGKMGEDNMKRLIEKRTTPFSEWAISEGVNKGPGRKRTGKMYDSVTHRVERGPKKIFVSFGWIKDFEKYFSYQETGFMNKFKGIRTKSGKMLQNGGQPVVKYGRMKWTNGMFALFDSRTLIKARMGDLTEQASQNISRRLNA
jgi:hypothetical protein